MGNFLIRDLEDDVHRKLRSIARRRGQSLEEFVRGVLRGVALRPPAPSTPMGRRLSDRFGTAGLAVGETIDELKGQSVRPADL